MKYIVGVLGILVASSSLLAQSAAVHGVVTDESGAVVPAAKVTLTDSSGGTKTVTADARGAYLFAGLDLGDYTLRASAPDLAQAQPAKVTVGPGMQTENLQLRVAATVQQVTVEDNAGPAVSTDANSNATATVIRGDDLNSLADDPEDMQADLEALAGPSAGPSGGSIYIDGFSTGDLPPKETIREIRVNQNPFSPEFDRLGLGRIEIFTKPGTDKYRGNLNYNIANDVWNSRNPYSAQKAPLQLNEFENTVSGPLNKRSSFSLDANQNDVNNGAIVNAVTVDPQTLAVNPFYNVFKTRQKRTRVSPRVDYQLNDNNTLTFRYGFTDGDIQGAGIGGFDLVSRGYHVHYLVHTVQAIETWVKGTTVNETRFQYYRNANDTLANSPSPETQVLGSFNTGGSQVGQYHDLINNLELQNVTSMVRGAHAWHFGTRMREAFEQNVSPQNFNGTFTFSGGLAPELNANNQAVVDSSGQPVLQQIDSTERYRRTLLFEQLGLSAAAMNALGGGPTQFTISAGNPALSIRRFDIGLFAGDDWRVLPNLTINLGVRYEMQTNINDWRDIAPRVGLAWAPGANAKTTRPKLVIRAGFGMFYDRFSLGNTLNADRYNGVVQQQYVITNPTFYFTVPTPLSLATFLSPQAIQEISSTMRAPYVMQSALTLERQLPKNTTLAVTYTNTHGLHQLRSEDINAPLLGTYNPAAPGSGVFPMGHPGPVFLMESSGLYNQNQLITNVNTRVSPSISLFGSYVFNRARSNTDGINTFPGIPYSSAGDYGPASSDIHHRVNVGGSINTKWNIRLNPLITTTSGAPFDITTGSDLYGTTLFNARPGFATDPSKPGVIATRYGLLDPNPSAGERLVPRNYGRGPGQMMVNLRVAKTFGFGAERKSAQSRTGSPGGLAGIFIAPNERRYSLIFSASVRNLFNHTNSGPIIGNITSPLFGLANQMAGSVNGEGFSENANNRRLELQMRLAF